MTRQTITACLVVYNEEAVIEQCLQSLQGVVEEILVAHDGECTDKTLDIAKKYGAKTFVLPHVGMCEPHRVFLLEKASCEWVLFIDADEFLSEALKKALPKLVEGKADGYEVIWPLWDGEKHITENGPYRPILFRRSQLYYLGFPHEPYHSYGTIEKVPYILEHRPKYNNFTFAKFRTKWVKWAKIQAQESLKPFSEIPRYNYPEKDWPRKMRLGRDFSFLFPFAWLITFYYSLRSGNWKQGSVGWKVAFMNASYFAMVYYFTTLYKLSPPKI